MTLSVRLPGAQPEARPPGAGRAEAEGPAGGFWGGRAAPCTVRPQLSGSCICRQGRRLPPFAQLIMARSLQKTQTPRAKIKQITNRPPPQGTPAFAGVHRGRATGLGKVPRPQGGGQGLLPRPHHPDLPPASEGRAPGPSGDTQAGTLSGATFLVPCSLLPAGPLSHRRLTVTGDAREAQVALGLALWCPRQL